MNTNDYYKVLGIDKSASKEEIKKAYRKLSLKHHPDKGGDVNDFKKLNEAYEILGNEEKRNEYDNPNKHQFQHMGHGDFPFPQDIFESLFRGQGGMPNIQIFRNGIPVRRENQPPAPITQTLTITIEEAFSGCSKPIEIERWIEEDGVKRVESETVYIDIMEGIDNNETIVVKDRGNIQKNGMKGDIRVIIRINNDTEFIREGLNLIYKKTLTLKESLCGCSFSIKHLNGKEYQLNNKSLVIKPNYKKICQQLGMKRGNHMGNMYIFFNVEFPDTLTPEQIEILSKTL